jgi:hypothetical protein
MQRGPCQSPSRLHFQGYVLICVNRFHRGRARAEAYLTVRTALNRDSIASLCTVRTNVAQAPAQPPCQHLFAPIQLFRGRYSDDKREDGVYSTHKKKTCSGEDFKPLRLPSQPGDRGRRSHLVALCLLRLAAALASAAGLLLLSAAAPVRRLRLLQLLDGFA